MNAVHPGVACGRDRGVEIEVKLYKKKKVKLSS
jgi:hypothetical protein